MRPVTPPPAEFEMSDPTPILTARAFVVICYISVAPWIQFHEYFLPQHEDERFAGYYDAWVRYSEDPGSFQDRQVDAEEDLIITEEGEDGAHTEAAELKLDASWYYRAMGQ